MSFRTTVILAALLAVLGGAFYFTEIRGGKKDPDEAKRLFTATVDDVESVEVITPKTEVALRREGDGWRLEKPIQAKGDRAAIDALVASLVNIKGDRTLEEVPKNPADFGLEKPEVTARFKAKGGAAWHRLEFGGRSPTGAWAYVRKDERPEVVLVPEHLRGEIQRPVLDLRDKAVMDVAADRVTRLVIHKAAAEPIELAKNEQWEIVKPVKARADEWRASGLVRQAADLKAKEFAAEPASDLAAYGLDKPSVRLELWEKDATAPKTLALAPAKGKAEILYARAEGNMTVVVVDPAILSDIPAGPWEIRDKSLFRYANKDVKKIRVAAGDRAVAVEREGENRWKVVEPAAGPAHEPKVTDLLFQLTGLRVDGVAAERPAALGPYGLDKPEITVTVVKTDGTEIGTLLIGKEAQERRYVQIRGEAPVYTLPSKDLKDLPRAPDDFREPKPEKKA